MPRKDSCDAEEGAAKRLVPNWFSRSEDRRSLLVAAPVLGRDDVDPSRPRDYTPWNDLSRVGVSPALLPDVGDIAATILPARLKWSPYWRMVQFPEREDRIGA